MSDDVLLQDVQNWLNQNGYVLEMEVAQAIMSHCSLVVQGFQYNDSITDKLRETDVFCEWILTKEDAEHSIDMTVECKSTTAPWVAFYGGSTRFQNAVFPRTLEGQYKDCKLCDSTDNLYHLGPGNEAPIAYTILEKKTKGDRDLAREAVLAAISAAVAVMRDIENLPEKRSKNLTHMGSIVLPVVVTKSPIFACSLNSTGEVNLSRVDNCWVLSSHESFDLPIRVLVTNYSVFNTFMWELAATCERLGFEVDAE